MEFVVGCKNRCDKINYKKTADIGLSFTLVFFEV